MRQFILVVAAALLPPEQAKHTRSTCMAENLIYLADKARPDAKFIIWAHNGHIREADDPDKQPNLGSILRARYGPAYFGFGFEFNQGSFLTRTVAPDGLLADLKEVTLPPAPDGSLAWFLSNLGHSLCILNLRAPVVNPLVERWLNTPQAVHFVAWVYDPMAQDYLELRSLRSYDGMIFIESTTPSRPTGHALRRVASRDGL